MVVDNKCGWGSYSSNVYLASSAAAAVLFGRTFEMHVEHIAAWVQMAMLPPNAPQRLRPLPTSQLPKAPLPGLRPLPDPMQIEYFLQALLKANDVEVHKLNLHTHPQDSMCTLSTTP